MTQQIRISKTPSEPGITTMATLVIESYCPYPNLSDINGLIRICHREQMGFAPERPCGMPVLHIFVAKLTCPIALLSPELIVIAGHEISS